MSESANTFSGIKAILKEAYAKKLKKGRVTTMPKDSPNIKLPTKR